MGQEHIFLQLEDFKSIFALFLYKKKIYGYSTIRRYIMETVQKILLVVTIIGAINWGSVGIFDFNIVEAIFGNDILTKVIYSLVGIAGMINIGTLFSHIDTK